MSGPGGASESLRRAVAEQIDQLHRWERAVRADSDDSVHQMRVTLRTLRSLLQAAPGAFPAGAAIGDELRWLAGLLGTARDAEVLAQRYRHELGELPSQLVRGRVRERLVDAAVQRYRTGRIAAVAAIDSPRYRRLLDRLDALAAAPPTIAPPTHGAATVAAGYRRVGKAAAAARTASGAHRDEALHRIRKAAKRLRYTAAAVGAPRVVAAAKRLQTLLGDHQDAVVSRGYLLQEAGAAHAAGEDGFTYGLLYQREDDLARSCRAQLDAALGELAEAVADPAGGRAGL